MKDILEMKLPKSSEWVEKWKLIPRDRDQNNPLNLESKIEPEKLH